MIEEDIAVSLAVLLSYVLVVRKLITSLQEGALLPGKVFSAFAVVLFPPLHLMHISFGKVTYEDVPWEAAILPGSLLLLSIYITVFAVLSATNKMDTRVMHTNRELNTKASIHRGTRAAVVAVVCTILWVVLTPRYGMLVDVLASIASGDTSYFSYARREKYTEGIFNTKIFTWLRYSLGPAFALLLVVATCRSHSLLMKLVGMAGCVLLLFSFSATLQKASMLMGIVYASIFYTALYYPSGVPRRQLMILGLVGLLLITGLLAVVYGVQYAEVEEFDRFGSAVDRLFGAGAMGLFWFTATIPSILDYQPLGVLLAPLSEQRYYPEYEVALIYGYDTTIQPGIIATLYAGFGPLACLLYPLIVVPVLILCNLFVLRETDCVQRSYWTALFSVSCGWLLANPLSTAFFSGGLFGVGLLYAVFRSRARVEPRIAAAGVA